MSFDLAEHLHRDGTAYAIHAFPLTDYCPASQGAAAA